MKESKPLMTRMRKTTQQWLRGLVPRGSALHLADTDLAVSDAHFEAALCRNCGAERMQPHCGQCGQKAVARFGFGDVANESWQSWRLFERSTLHSALRLARAPGMVAREYVLGARQRHVHPLKLLLFAVALLVILIAHTGYLTAGQTQLTEQMQVVAAWGRWSFSLGLFALLIASLLVMRRHLNYNAVEHLILATYVQFVIIVANVINLLPLLWLDASQWVTPWRWASSFYMTPLELMIVTVACQQFFRLSWRRNALRLLAIPVVFFIAKKALLFVYARFIVWIVSNHAV